MIKRNDTSYAIYFCQKLALYLQVEVEKKKIALANSQFLPPVASTTTAQFLLQPCAYLSGHLP
jgi:hypothetical protein